MPPQMATRDICRLCLDERLSNREIGRVAGVSPTTVNKYRNLLKINKIFLQQLTQLSDAELEVVCQTSRKGMHTDFVEPDWEQVQQSWRQDGVTVSLLYAEYLEQFDSGDESAPDAMSESTFGRRLRDYIRRQGLSMRQSHPPGKAMYVDFSGKRPEITHPTTGEKTPVELFVAVLGSSKLLAVTAVATQQKADWIEANIRALEYFGGVPAMVVPDNLKSAVVKPGGKGRAPIINRSYMDFAEHYGIVIVPARPKKPQDKSHAELAVKIAKTWILAKLRGRIFFSLADLNQAIAPLVERINEKPTRGLQGRSRRDWFDEIEKPTLAPLPNSRHEYTDWRMGQRVPKDYHIPFNKDFYSVPHYMVGKTVHYSVSRTCIKIYGEHSSSPVAVHRLGNGQGQTVTNKEHLHDRHRRYASENVEDLLEWARAAGEPVETLFIAILENKRISPILAIKQLSKAQRLSRSYSLPRLMEACLIANSVGVQHIDSVENILKNEIDLRRKREDQDIVSKIVPHTNVRGPDAYKGDSNGK